MKLLRAFAIPLVAALAVTARLHAANWTFIALDPPNSLFTEVNATTGFQQGGSRAVEYVETPSACIWSGTAASFVDLSPAGSSQSSIQGMAGNQQVGSAAFPVNYVATSNDAGIWSGTADSFVDVSPAGISDSTLLATTGTQQVGAIYGFFSSEIYSNLGNAGIWYGTAASFVNVNPAGAAGSALFATTGALQGGVAYFGSEQAPHAGLWAGTAASFVDLNPAGASSSEVIGMAGNQQVGYADNHAALWFGTAASFTDLTPPGVSSATLYATNGTYQVGSITTPGSHAGIWTGSASSFLDLNPYLPDPNYQSWANAVWSDGATILIAGYAISLDNEHEIAGLWKRTPSTVAVTAATTKTGVTFTITNPGNASEPVRFTRTTRIENAYSGPTPSPLSPRSPIVVHYSVAGVDITSALEKGTATATIPAFGTATVVLKVTTRHPLAFQRTIHAKLTASSQADPSKSGSAKATIVLKAAGSAPAR